MSGKLTYLVPTIAIATCVGLTACGTSSPSSAHRGTTTPVVSLTPAPSQTPSRIEHALLGRWEVTKFSYPDGIAAWPAPNHPFITFSGNGTVNGFDSVNPWQGTWKVVGDGIRITNTAYGLVGLVKGAPRDVTSTVNAFTTMVYDGATNVSFNGPSMRLSVGRYVLIAVRQ